MDFSSKVYKIVEKIPKGKVATYGQIAIILGNKNLARSIGSVLHKNPKPTKIPCHRVVDRDGRLSKNFAFGKELIQRNLLEKEGIRVMKNRVDLKRYLLLTPLTTGKISQKLRKGMIGMFDIF